MSRYQKGKTSLDFTGARDSEWHWHQLGHMQVCTSLQTDNHASTPPFSFLQAGCPSCRPTNSVRALKATMLRGWSNQHQTIDLLSSLLDSCCWHCSRALLNSAITFSFSRTLCNDQHITCNDSLTYYLRLATSEADAEASVPSKDKLGGGCGRKGIKHKSEDDRSGGTNSPDGVTSRRIVRAFASVIFPYTIKSRRWWAIIKEVYKGCCDLCITGLGLSEILIHSWLKVLTVN